MKAYAIAYNTRNGQKLFELSQEGCTFDPEHSALSFDRRILAIVSHAATPVRGTRSNRPPSDEWAPAAPGLGGARPTNLSGFPQMQFPRDLLFFDTTTGKILKRFSIPHIGAEPNSRMPLALAFSPTKPQLLIADTGGGSGVISFGLWEYSAAK